MEKVTNWFSRPYMRVQDFCEWKFGYAHSRSLKCTESPVFTKLSFAGDVATFSQLTSSREI